MKKGYLILVFSVVLALIFAVGCSKSEKPVSKPKKAAKVKKETPKTVEKQSALNELAEKARLIKENSVCYGPLEPGKESKTVKINGKPYVFTGGVVKAPADKDNEARIGVISDIKGESDNNKKALKEYLDFFKKEGVELIVVLGDTAETKKEIVSMLSILLNSGLPVAVIMGNREPLSAYAEAMAELEPKYPNLINMNRYRVFDADDFVVFSLPGYYNIQYVYHPKDSCVYDEKEIEKLRKKMGVVLDRPLVLISHGPFRGKGKNAIDYAVEGGNVGDPKIAELIKKVRVKVGLFGNIHEAGGKAVGPDMKTILKPEQKADALYLNVGPADTDPWQMNDGSISHGMCGVVYIQSGKDGKVWYKMYKRQGDEHPKPTNKKEQSPKKKENKK